MIFILTLSLLAWTKPWLLLFAVQEPLLLYARPSRFDYASSVFFCFVFSVYALARLTRGLVFFSFILDTCAAYAWRARHPGGALQAKYSVCAYLAMALAYALFPQLFLLVGALGSLLDVRWDLALIRIPLCVVAHF